jgi:hypothetical protein
MWPPLTCMKGEGRPLPGAGQHAAPAWQAPSWPPPSAQQEQSLGVCPNGRLLGRMWTAWDTPQDSLARRHGRSAWSAGGSAARVLCRHMEQMASLGWRKPVFSEYVNWLANKIDVYMDAAGGMGRQAAGCRGRYRPPLPWRRGVGGGGGDGRWQRPDRSLLLLVRAWIAHAHHGSWPRPCPLLLAAGRWWWRSLG